MPKKDQTITIKYRVDTKDIEMEIDGEVGSGYPLTILLDTYIQHYQHFLQEHAKYCKDGDKCDTVRQHKAIVDFISNLNTRVPSQYF